MITCPKCHHQVADDAKYCGNCATPMTSQAASESDAPHDSFVGKCIDDKYYITERIASGGMGVVYRATQKGVGQDVAIKKLHAGYYQDPAIVKRFINEARSYGEITHPNAVKLHDLLNVNGQICIVMEYVKGRTLRDYIDNHYLFTNRQIIDICLQIADALGTVHHAGIIHRDLKSDNIMLLETVSKRFSVKILDFGIAKIRSGSDVSQTQNGVIVGSPEFMAPEQCYGQKIDHRVDIYAFGILMYLMICGRLPFNADSGMALMQMQISDSIPPMVRPDNSEVLPGFTAIVNKCLEKDPDDRYSSFADVIVDLTEIQEGRQTSIAVSAVHEIVTDIPQDSIPDNETGHVSIPQSEALQEDEADDAFVLDDDDSPKRSMQFTIDASESELRTSDDHETSDSDEIAEDKEDEDDHDGFSLGDIEELSSNADLTAVSSHESHTGRNIFIVLLVLLLGGGGVVYFLQHTGHIDIINQKSDLSDQGEKQAENLASSEQNSAEPEAKAGESEAASAPIVEPELPKLPDPAPISAVTSRENIELGIARATIIRAEQMVKAASLDETEPLLKAIEAQKSVLTDQDQTRYAQIIDTKERYQTMIDQSKKAQRKMHCEAIESLIAPLQEDEQAMRDVLGKYLQKCQNELKGTPTTVD